MEACTQSQCCQMKPKLSMKKESVGEGLLSSVKTLLQSRKELCSISDHSKSNKTGDFIEVTFLGLSEESGSRNIQGVASFHLDIPELVKTLHLCNLNENEFLLLRDGKEEAKSNAPQGLFSGAVCLMSTTSFPFFKSDALFVMLSKYSAGIKYAMEQGCSNTLNNKADNHEDDDTNNSVSSIEDDFVTALEHLDEEDPTHTNDNQGHGWEAVKNQRDASSQTQPTNCLDVSGSKIIFSSVRRRSSIKSAVLMGYLGLPEVSASVKNTVTTSICNTWTQRSLSSHEKIVFSPSPVETSESECSSPSPIIFLDEEGYQKSLRAKLNLPKIPVGKDGIEDSDSELSEFFDSFDRFDEPETSLEDHLKNNQNAVLESPPKKRKCAKGNISTICMNPQKFKFERPTLSASVKKPTPRKAESPFSNRSEVPDSPRPTKTCSEDNGSLFSPIRSSAFSPLGVPSTTDCTSHLVSHVNISNFKDSSYDRLSEYANQVCSSMFDTVLNAKNLPNVARKEQEKTPKLKRKSHGKELERKSKSKHRSVKGGIQKFAADLVEKSLGNAFKDLQRGVSSCTSALCHLAARLTSYVFQMAFYEIGRRQAFSIKKRAINGLANLMVSEVMTSALQELRYIKKQMVTNAVTRFAADLAEELIFEGIMEVCQFSHPPTPNVTYCQSFDYEDIVVTSYAKDLSESVIQEAFIELSQVNVGFTPEAAISVSMDNLKYVSSEGVMQASQASPILPVPRSQELSPVTQQSKKDYTVQYALFFTSGLVSSVPVPVAAKVLSQQPISNDQMDMASQNFYVDSVNNYHISTKRMDDMSSDKTIILGNSQQDGDGVKPFSVTMVDMIVNEAYDVIKSAKTVDDYAETMTRKIVDMPFEDSLLEGNTSQSRVEDWGKGIFKYSLSKSMQTSSKKEIKSSYLVDHSTNLPHETDMIYYSPKPSETQRRIFRCPQVVENAATSPCLTVKQLEKRDKFDCPGISNASCSKTNSETMIPRRNIHSADGSDPSLFGLHSCLPHINSFSTVMCSCGDDFCVEENYPKESSNVSALPGTPPPTPLTTYDVSPERSMRKLNKRLKGQLAKEFYPATPPSTPHMSIQEHDNGKKDDFVLRLMRSLSEEVESSSSDDSSEELEVSEETFRYADYLSSNIISIATDMAAYSLVDDSSQGAAPRNLSQVSVLSDKWGYPAYMRNITEDHLETLCKYANNVAGYVISEAKETIGSRKNSLCDIDYCIPQTSGKDCRPKESTHTYVGMSYKASDPRTLTLPYNNGGTGLTSKYPSCESVTEEYADHLIRVLKMEGGNNELILDQYAGRLVYRAMKSGLQQASKTIKVKCNRKIVSRVKPEANTSKEILRLLNRTQHSEKDKRRQSNVNVHVFPEDSVQADFTGLIHFAESLAQTITCDVRRKLKMSAASLPKSLTDSCLYSKSKNDYVTGDLIKSSFPKSLLPLPNKQKLYHSTGSLNDPGLNDGILKAIEQYACKVVDRTLEVSMEAAKMQATETKKKAEKGQQGGKLIHSYGTACRLCSAIEQHGSSVSSCHFLLGHDSSRKGKPCSKSRQNACQKSRLFHLNIPKIHIDLDKRSIFADKLVTAALEKAERELSNSSLGADSGIGHNGISFAESLTTEIMRSAMKNIGHVNISSIGKDGFQSLDSVTSQHTSVSMGDDSTGSWSNLSFEDEHQDECSSFLHLSDSNGNSSSWSSLGLEGDLCEENLSFSPSDSMEDKEDHKITEEVVNEQCKILHIRNVDMGPSTLESQLRMILQWIAASESGISEIHFLDHSKYELLPLFRCVQEKGWKIGDLLQAILQYCENVDMSSDIPSPLYGWLLEYC